MTKTLSDLLRAAAHGIPTFQKLFDSLGAKLTPELAAEARQFYQTALTDQRLGDAGLGAFVTAVLYASLGDQAKELRARFDMLQAPVHAGGHSRGIRGGASGRTEDGAEGRQGGR